MTTRRTFLKSSLVAAAVAKAIAGFTGVMSVIGSGSRYYPQSGGGGGGDTAADWQSRISGAGVVWHHNFDSAAEVNAFRWTGSYGGGNDPLAVGDADADQVEWVSSGGVDGGGYMRITRDSPGVDTNCWWRPFSPLTGASNGRGEDDPGANGTLTPQTFVATDGGNQLLTWAASGNAKPGWYGHSSNVNSYFDGTEFYLQVRVRADPRRTESGNIKVGKFTSFTTTNNSYTLQELVTYGGYWTGADGNGIPNIHNVYQGYGYDPLAGSSTGTPKNPTTPQWAYSGGWDTLLYHVSPGREAVDETVFQVWAAHPGDTEYTLIWDVVYPAHYDTDGGSSGGVARAGWNAFLAWIYHNGATMTTFTQEYDQIIFSKETIPLPRDTPAWFRDMADGVWVEVATGAGSGYASGSRINQVLPSPLPDSDLGGESSSSITTAWTGGAVDQARAEYMLVANGGHADYCGNEAYGLSLLDETPGWRRLSDPTPNASIGTLSNEGGGVFSDGRPRAMHSCNQVFGDGRVWFPMMNSVSSPAGGHANQVVSYDRDSLGLAASPLAWTGSNLGPYELHGSSGANTNSYGFGYGLFDRVNHRIYGVANGSGSFGIWWWRFDSQGGSIGSSTGYENTSLHIEPAWAVCAHDLGIIVVGGQAGNINVLNLAANTWARPTNISGTGFYDEGAGGVYVAQNQCIAVASPVTTGRTIYKLTIPTSGGAYDPSGTWVWTSSTPSGPTIDPGASGNRFAYSKFNIIEDMGDGRSALVYVGNVAAGTYVYKIPASGL